jgi:hypothetical protein
MTADTVIVHDLFLHRTFFGSSRAEVLAQFSPSEVTSTPSGGWRFEFSVPGFKSPVVLSYTSDFSRDEASREAAREALSRIARSYATRYSVFLAERQHP